MQYVEVSDLDKIVRGLVDRLHSLETREAPPLVWHDVVAFENGWTNYGSGYDPAAYTKDSSGRVYLRGLITAGVVGLPAFTLPAGYRYKPRATQYIHIPVMSNNALGGVLVYPYGGIVPYFGSNAWVELSAVHFPG